MNKLRVFFCFVLLWISSVNGANALMDEIQMFVEGKQKNLAISSIEKNGVKYVHCRNVMQNLGGVSYWYSSSKELRSVLQHRQFVFKADRTFVDAPDEDIKLPAKILFYDNKIFVPLSFFTSVEFRDAIGRKITYNDVAHSLDVERYYDLGEMDYFSFATTMKVFFPLGENVSYKTYERGKKSFEIILPSAVAKKTERVYMPGDIINSVWVVQKKDEAHIIVELGNLAGKWSVFREDDSLQIEVNSDEYALARHGMEVEKETVITSQEDSKPVIKPQIPDTISATHDGKIRVVIDAGHGGKDPGALYRKSRPEKELNLEIAKLLYRDLKKDRNFEVIMTRDSDEFISLSRRSEIANEFKVDVFISIHANAFKDRNAHGYEVYFLAEDTTDPWAREVVALENSVRALEDAPKYDATQKLLHSLAKTEYINSSSKLAGYVSNSLDKNISLKNKGVKQGDLYVLRGTYSTAILIETGFVTNRKDAKFLNSRSGREKIARGIYDGLKDFVKKEKSD
jgi:N-acetylmuramoyl-L-alanine amidase